jgi:alanyl-tRNA synthetase
LEANVTITQYRKVSSKKDGDLYQLVFNMTPFYPEGGGQVGDKGFIKEHDGNLIYIVDTKKENNLIIHFAKSLPKDPTQILKVVVDEKERFRTACNHSASHLLHQALREILGTHVEQKGSAVHSKSLRFDFSHFAKLTADELRDVEDFVNARIDSKLMLEEYRNIPIKTALEKGAMALFGEKYGDTVRAIQFGESVELCGGTHIQNTGDIWHFKIVSEGAIAAGVRRIEAITGDTTKEFFLENTHVFSEVKGVLKNTKNPVKAIIDLQEENATLKKQVEALQKDKAKNLTGDLINQVEKINGIHYLAVKLDLDQNSIKDLAFDLGNKIENLFLLVGTETDGKAFLSCYIAKNLVEAKKLDAGKVVRELGKLIEGGGGGQAYFATAGGKKPEGIADALEKGKNYIL